jgi:aryl-alcohol dehydrogenase-like predicted oxidoreductase
MQIRNLGGSGLLVSAVGLGCNNFGQRTDLETSRKVIHKAIDLGITLFDTADIYAGMGGSETVLGQVLGDRRKDIVLATKYSKPMSTDGTKQGASRRYIMSAVEASLTRLKTDYIDLYQQHDYDPRTPIEETLRALDDLIRQGKVRYIGSSTFPAEQIVESHWVAETRGRERFRTEQPPYSIFARRVEADILPTVLRYGMGAIVWSPLSQGWLTGKWRRGATPNDTQRQNLQPHLYDMQRTDNQRKLDLIEQLDGVAKDAGISLMHMALGFVTAHPAVTSAIIGPRTFDQLDGLLAGADVTLSPDTLDAIDLIAPPGTNISHDDDGYMAPEISDKALRRRPSVAQAPDSVRQTIDNIEKYRAAQQPQLTERSRPAQ